MSKAADKSREVRMEAVIITALIHVIKDMKEGCITAMVGLICKLMTGIILIVGDTCMELQ